MASYMDKSNIERRMQLWFANIVGLPSIGLNLASDCHHVKDKELVHMFGNKVKNKGYHFQVQNQTRGRRGFRSSMDPFSRRIKSQVENKYWKVMCEL